MAKTKDTKLQNVETGEIAPATKEEISRTARRRFLRQALAVTSGIALSEMLPFSLLEAAPQTPTVCAGSGGAFVKVGEISRQAADNRLKAVIKVMSGNRNVPTTVGGTPRPTMLRYFNGYNTATPNQYAITTNNAGPGPTLRCEIGDTVQITFLNQVQVQDFSGTLDVGEEGRGSTDGCDKSSKPPNPQTGQGGDANWYPANDKYPNCFHGSSSANMHFHGTHVTPATTGDNVLINVRPDPKMSDATVTQIQKWFEEVFQNCHLNHEPKRWEQLPSGWRQYQMGDLVAGIGDPNKRGIIGIYDRTAPYVGPHSNPNGRGLPPELQLWPQNAEAIGNRTWPQFYIGSYPICFQIPKGDPNCDPNTGGPSRDCLKMGQAPGTHWYHAHKHGSTTINLFNGLAGALIIEDNSPTGYDGALKAFYAKTNNKLEDVMIVFMQITDTLNLISTNPPGPPQILVNGQLKPTIMMKQGEVKLFRMLNATVQSFINFKFAPASTSSSSNMQFKQTAQDGVQLAWANYSKSDNGTQTVRMSPANRVDLLVQAPAAPGCYVLQTTATNPVPLLYINVTSDSVSPAMGFPATQSDYPPMPRFLENIPASSIYVKREIVYSSRKGVAVTPNGRALTQFLIDGKQFEDQIVNQVMRVDTSEEWKIVNADENNNIAHPFHIHINPFQIVEIYDPTGFYNNGTPLHVVFDDPKTQPPNQFVWWDTFGIPPAKVTKDSGGKITSVDPGYFRMRTRFVDFTGMYVQHCHILAHEDRGMMQLLEVVPNKTVIKHH